MGVTHCDHIARFSVNSIDYTDHLRIVYDRPHGSLLPVSRTYHFPRIQKSLEGGGTSPGEVVMESDPALREALEELRALLAARESKQDVAAEMLAELQWLEEELCVFREHVKGLIEKVKAN